MMSLCAWGFLNTKFFKMNMPENTTEVSVSLRAYKARVFMFETYLLSTS